MVVTPPGVASEASRRGDGARGTAGALRAVRGRAAVRLAVVVLVVGLARSGGGPDREGGGPGGAPTATASAPAKKPPSACVLDRSGPVRATAAGQVIEDKLIVAEEGHAVVVEGLAGVVIRNCEIHHRGGAGIYFAQAPGLRIENTIVVHDGAPPAGPNSSDRLNNIEGHDSAGVVITDVRLLRGSSGAYLERCPRARLARLEIADVRGPFPRGQCVQLDKSSRSVLEDFSCLNPASTSWTEDNVSVYESSDVVVRRGLVDGNNSPTGVAVMFEQSDGESRGGLCEDVDAVRQGNGCFFAYPGRGVTFRRTRARDNVCGDQGRGPPSSGGLAWGGSPESRQLRLEESSYDNLCGPLSWDDAVFVVRELEPRSFTPRAPLTLSFCWQTSTAP